MPSKIKTMKKAPTGSIRANTPFSIPIELPIKKPVRSVIRNKEYLLHGLDAQYSNRLIDLPKLRCKLVD